MYRCAAKIDTWKQVSKVTFLIFLIWIHYVYVMEELADHRYSVAEKISLRHMANIDNCAIRKSAILRDELFNNSRVPVLNLGQDFCHQLQSTNVYSQVQSDSLLLVEIFKKQHGKTFDPITYHMTNVEEDNAVAAPINCKDDLSERCVKEILTKSFKPSLVHSPNCQQVIWSRYATLLKSETSSSSMLRMPRDLMQHFCENDKECPFARVIGACNNFLITEHKGCSLDQFHFQPLRLRIKIALNLIKAMEWLDKPQRKFNVLLNNLANVNMICDAEGNTIILDPKEMLLTTTDYKHSDNSDDWFCVAGLSQNFYEAAQLLLSTSEIKQSAANNMQPNWRFTNFLHGIDQVLRDLNQEPMQKLPSRAQWLKLSSEKRSYLRRQLNQQLQNVVVVLNNKDGNVRKSLLYSICITLDICLLILTIILGWLRPRFSMLCNEICDVELQYDIDYPKRYESYRR